MSGPRRPQASGPVPTQQTPSHSPGTHQPRPRIDPGIDEGTVPGRRGHEPLADYPTSPPGQWRPPTTISEMVEEPESSATPTLDEWIGEVGESGVLAAVEALKASVANGTATVLRDKESLQAYWDSRRRQTA
jgi:hypothetical protein